MHPELFTLFAEQNTESEILDNEGGTVFFVAAKVP